MKYIKRFNTEIEYDSYCRSNSFVLPNLSLIDELIDIGNEVRFNPELDGAPDEDEEENSNIFTFSIDGIEYQAENEMTWRGWVNSRYNVDGFFIHDSHSTSYVCYGSFCVSSPSSHMSPLAAIEKPTLSMPVYPDDKITPGGNYLLEISI